MSLARTLLGACLAALTATPVAHAADADVGRDIAAACASCHSAPAGKGDAPPSLAGRDAAEIARLVHDFRDGKRPSTLMQQLARGYSDAQIAAAAAYLAAQKKD